MNARRMNSVKLSDKHDGRTPPKPSPPKTAAENTVSDIVNKFQKKISKQNNVIQFSALYQELLSNGIDIFQDDRTAPTLNKLFPYFSFLSNNHLHLSDLDFQNFIDSSRGFLIRCFEGKLAIKNFKFLRLIVEIFQEKCKNGREDKITNSIPHLAKQNHNLWGITICTVDGQMDCFGDHKAEFTLQDACKPFLYALAMEIFGTGTVNKYVGLQLSNLPPFAKCLHKNKALNPVLESGAILLCSLIINEGLKDLSVASKFEYILHFIKRFSGNRHVGYNKSIYLSLRSNSHEYMSVMYFLEAKNCFQWEHNTGKDLEFYLQIRSLELNCESLSMIGATLANCGINPFTEKRIISPDNCRSVFSFMQLLSGGILSPYLIKEVCLPVLFSISGLCLLILPHQLAIGFFSPKLHSQLRVSTKPLIFIKQLQKEFNLHPYLIDSESENALDFPVMKCKHKCQMAIRACQGNIIDLARYLYDPKEANIEDYMGKSILHYASINGHINCVEYIIRNYPALLLKTDIKGWTAREEAIYFGHHDIAELLEKYERSTSRQSKTSNKQD